VRGYDFTHRQPSPCFVNPDGVRRARLPGRTIDRDRAAGDIEAVAEAFDGERKREGNAHSCWGTHSHRGTHMTTERVRPRHTVNIDILPYDGFDEWTDRTVRGVRLRVRLRRGEGESDGAGRRRDDVTERPAASDTSLDERWVTASHGTRVGVDGVLREPNADEASDLPRRPRRRADRARDEDASGRRGTEGGDVPRALGEYHAAGVRTAAVCTGAMLLRQAGVTDGRRAVPTPSDDRRSRERAPRSSTRARRRRRRPAFHRGWGDLRDRPRALSVVEQEFGEEITDRVATVIEYERRYEVAGGRCAARNERVGAERGESEVVGTNRGVQPVETVSCQRRLR